MIGSVCKAAFISALFTNEGMIIWFSKIMLSFAHNCAWLEYLLPFCVLKKMNSSQYSEAI